MSQDDPFAMFGDDDKTIVRPMPGGRRRPTSQEPVLAAPPPIDLPELLPGHPHSAVLGDNPLVSAAHSMLSLASRLRNTPVHDQVAELQQQLVKEMRNFENQVLQQGVPQDRVRYATYALCSFLDETILNTPWGAQSFWGHQSLLVIFHKETWGGEKFFQFLEGLVRQPGQNLHLIELFWLCMSLGFEGKYRVMQNGLAQLEHARNDLYQLIQRVRGTGDRELSPRWQGIRDQRNPIIRHVPVWVIAAGAGLVLLLAYLGFALAINSASDSVARDLYALARDEAQVPARASIAAPAQTSAPAPAPKAARFRPLLAAEIARNMVEVVDDRILRIHNSFASGSDQLKPEFVPMLDKIAQELARGGDSVLVTGHTDNVPIVSARFPSNFDLSTARARNVADLLRSSGNLKTGNVRYEGRADYEPLVPNDSADHRAMNRRVDILIQ